MSNPYGMLVPFFYEHHFARLGLHPGDAVAPVFASGPAQSTTTDTAITIVANITDDSPPITFYAVAVADAAGAPSAAQIKAGTDSADADAPSGSITSVTSGDNFAPTCAGLTASTAYDIYYVATDTFANDTSVAKLDITTAATPTYDRNDTVRDAASGQRMVRSAVDDAV